MKCTLAAMLMVAASAWPLAVAAQAPADGSASGVSQPHPASADPQAGAAPAGTPTGAAPAAAQTDARGATGGAGGAPIAATADVVQPRAYGHTIGDVLTQRVLLRSAGRAFEPAELPKPERVGAWFERREPRVERSADGERWLVVDYQLINAPPALKTVRLPAWELKDARGGEPLRVAEWPLSVGPLTARAAPAQGALQPLQADRPAPFVDTAAPRRQIAIWLGLLVLALAAWAGWLLWRNWQSLRHQPFAMAWRELRHLDESAPPAWHAMHRAFDRTAGRVVQPATLPQLFQRAPHLERLRPQIEQFYEQSAALFFGGSLPARPLDVRSLCGALRRVEKRHER